MSTILNIRGTSGSGKSTAVRALFDETTLSLRNGNKVENYHTPSRNLYTIGRYETACGGCDAVKTQDEVCDRVRTFAQQGHVIFEGLLISHLFSRYHALDRELTALGHRYVWLFLDTPLEDCLTRVNARRTAKGVTDPVNPQNTTQKWHDARRVFKKCQDAGLDARWVSNDTVVKEMLSCLV